MVSGFVYNQYIVFLWNEDIIVMHEERIRLPFVYFEVVELGEIRRLMEINVA